MALELLRFGEALDLMVADYRPNQLTGYLFELANRYSAFFEQCPVIRGRHAGLAQSRLLLCDLTARTIQKAWIYWGFGSWKRCRFKTGFSESRTEVH